MSAALWVAINVAVWKWPWLVSYASSGAITRVEDWSIAAILFGGIIALRLLLSPYWAWKEMKTQRDTARADAAKALASKGEEIAAFRKQGEDREKADKKHALKIIDAYVAAVQSGKTPLQALLAAGAADFDSNDEVVRLCDDLARFGHGNPFDMLLADYPKEGYLQFLEVARVRGKRLSRESIYEDALEMSHPASPPASPPAENLSFADFDPEDHTEIKPPLPTPDTEALPPSQAS